MAVNANAFTQPHWRVIAGGFDTERWFEDDQGQGTGGIANPQPTRLPSGQYYYRFASSQSPRAAQLGGGWWLDFENFNTVRRFAQDNGYTLREAARLMLALPYSWTRVDRLVRALLREPLHAWTGLGKAAQEPATATASAGAKPGQKGTAPPTTTWIPTQYVAVRQLYVPGLQGVAADGLPLFESVFSQPAEITPL
jgi:hypothetical protein